MAQKLVDIDAFRAEAMAGHAPETTLFKFAADAEPQLVVGASARTRRFVFSDATVDHSNDVIAQSGWDLSIFRRNPVALFGHDSSAPPIGKASNVAVQGGKLIGDIEFASEEVYPFANTIFELVNGGFIKAVSVGFLPKDWKFTSDKNRPNGLDFIKQVLLEISVVPIPANPSALIAARASGIDTRPLKIWAERILDGDHTGSMQLRDLEALRAQAAEPARRRTTRSAPNSHPLMGTIDDVGTSIAGERAAIKAVQAAIASPDEPPLDEVQLKMAIGHFSGAITSKNMGLACIRAALSKAAEADNEPPTGNPTQQAARVREAALLRAGLASAKTPAETPAERRRHAAELRRELSAPTASREQRLAEAVAVKRALSPILVETSEDRRRQRAELLDGIL